jgi:hypothetical protein
MPQERLPMRKIRDVLRLKASGLSNRKITASIGRSARAAGECIRPAQEAGLSLPLPEDLTDETLDPGSTQHVPQRPRIGGLKRTGRGSIGSSSDQA